MTIDPLPTWQQQALDRMSASIAEWLPDDKLHLVLIRAPFKDPTTGREITDPAFERLLEDDPVAAQQQLEREFIADQQAAALRDQQRAAEHESGTNALRSFVATKRRARHTRRQPTPQLSLIP